MLHRLIPTWSVRLALLVGVLLIPLAQAQTPAPMPPETASIRKVYESTQSRLSTLSRWRFQAQRPDVSYPSQVTAWADGPTLRKLEVVDADDSGDVVGEYFFDGGELVFFFGTIKSYNAQGRQATRSESRQYFWGQRMGHWLLGLRDDRSVVAPQSAEFAQEARLRASVARFYATTALQNRPAQPKP
ncbi:hypothetical protein PSQ40_02665 [Curvibacter sp. HBC61]|uniref:Uncharacterized protein n=1 Tax=Curvibacter cyanobacteriorum TaxID=3026422 RepID=A0ABT5MTU8_9BURK|nr:hypothetical protein [Curvibacter sp. HBC61]MDD0837465.1 hypothetical protein [Curvibacter sp. HBC61]